MCTTFYKEIATYLSPIKTTTCSKVKCKYYKPYWDEELSILWKNAIYNEKVFRKFKGSLGRKQDLSLQYQISLRSFDKALRKKERLYRRKNAEKIESLNNVNHKEFWSEINKLGPQKTGQIPNNVYVENSVVSDTDVVLTKWKNDFQQHYNPPKDDK